MRQERRNLGFRRDTALRTDDIVAQMNAQALSGFLAKRRRPEVHGVLGCCDAPPAIGHLSIHQAVIVVC